MSTLLPLPSLANLTHLLNSALPQDVEEGMGFYPAAHNWCVALTTLGAPSVEHAAGIYAALSPKNDWDHNLGDCFEVVRLGKHSTCSTTGVNHRKAIRIADGEHPEEVLRGPKVRNFYRAIADPGNLDPVPVDRHLIRAAYGTHVNETWLSREGARSYNAIHELYTEVGRQTGLGNRAASIIWFVQRRLRLGELTLPLVNHPFHCGRRMHGHGWDKQVRGGPPRRRWRCSVCGRVDVENPARHPNGARGQLYTDERGRTRVYLGREDPRANSGGWQYVYRLRVAEALARPLRTDEHVHHVDGDTTNNALHNLELLTPAYHGRLHASAMLVARDEMGRFAEVGEPAPPFPWPRRGAVLGNAARGE